MFSAKHMAKQMLEASAVLKLIEVGRFKYFRYGNPSTRLKGYIYETEVRSIDGFTYITFKFSDGRHLGLKDFTFCLDTPSRFELGENTVRMWGMDFKQQGKISKKPAFELLLSETGDGL